MNIEPALYWITERESVRRKREAGLPPPWTVDPILRDYSFCNVRREHDRVTMHIARTQREPNVGDPLLWFGMMVVRLFNWPETLDELGYAVPFDRDRIKRVVTARMQHGEQVFGPAYVIPNGGSSKAKVEYIADDVLHPLWKAREHLTPREGNRLVVISDRLTQFQGIGGFLAAQALADAKYGGVLRSAPDWMTFAVSGPGSRRGLNRIVGRPVDSPWTERAWQAAFARFEALIRPKLHRIGLGDLHAQDLQNCLCEIDKHLRGTLDEGRPKRKYRR
jgi:hypothetical protein